MVKSAGNLLIIPERGNAIMTHNPLISLLADKKKGITAHNHRLLAIESVESGVCVCNCIKSHPEENSKSWDADGDGRFWPLIAAATESLAIIWKRRHCHLYIYLVRFLIHTQYITVDVTDRERLSSSQFLSQQTDWDLYIYIFMILAIRFEKFIHQSLFFSPLKNIAMFKHSMGSARMLASFIWGK